MKVYVVSAMHYGKMLGCLGAYTTRKKAEERVTTFKKRAALFKSVDDEECYSCGANTYPATYAEIAEVEVEDDNN